MIRALLVLAVIFSGLAAVLTRGRDSLADVLRTTTVSDLTNGLFAKHVDKAIFNAVPRSSALEGIVTGLEYRVLGDAGPLVRAGCGDWLYTIEELRAERHDRDNMALRAELLRRLTRAIRLAGSRLVIVPVPDKAEQVEAELCGVTAVQSRLRDQFWNELDHLEGAFVVDLRNDWPKPGYWKTDTHWDQIGAHFAARQIAKAVTRTLGPGQDAVRLVDRSIRQRSGDLARLAGLTEAPRSLAPAPEQEREVKLEVSRSGGLLDDTPEPEIILAGSSFSLNSGFVEYLQASLSREVAQISQPGGGFAGALLETLDKRAGSLENVKAVIWEWPMRSLVFPPSDAEKNFMRRTR
ncbi:alginate O-acetyltransferase AlgX-related protein [Bradyrhizobium guangdongense]|uniref:AlgX/AlgJ SGNH hydrolase-like domain-containing protein n=1 Tax=Bradyrhizobium guangdongense TaxID=1325090 RepID=A0A410V4D8_9BRAD|nr:hypothetical protein [Bradyrhizobium guangdongense]QAU38522.1 hypothetical protein X265_13185 [Bradyrhizobium guangdongense]QOZ59582.1 hypothetical protein XH86_13190 [Bradyrhizobium guangdongense]GGI34538.1 hypothetical protein GCM10010987_79870 [Bradyrhizobium guangdongense]